MARSTELVTGSLTPPHLRTMFTYNMFSALNQVLKVPNWRSGLCLSQFHAVERGNRGAKEEIQMLYKQMKGRKNKTQRAQ